MSTAYRDRRIVITTKHHKEQAVAPEFRKLLAAHVYAGELDTDQLGTFTYEKERIGSALECVRQKCLWGMQSFDVSLGLASEGSFGPHPQIPITVCDQEVLYFIDQEKGFELYETEIANETNFQAQTINSTEHLFAFIEHAQFPSHGVVIRPNIWSDKSMIFKDIDSHDDLLLAFNKSCKVSDDGCAWVETDMRAHRNPTRMMVIQRLGQKLARRLSEHCLSCDTPGWGRVGSEQGLLCAACGAKTALMNRIILGCAKCDYTEYAPAEHMLKHADPQWCSFCNP